MAYNISIYSEYSMFNSLISIDKLVNHLVSENIKAVAVTDQNMFGTYKLYQKCLKSNIKTVFGLEVLLSDVSDLSLLLYAKNNNGYKNLMNIETIKNQRKAFDGSCLSFSDIFNYLDDLIVVIKLVKVDVLKNGAFILELKQRCPITFIGISKEQILEIKKIDELNVHQLAYVACNEIRYFNDKDKKALRVLKALQKNSSLKNINDNFDYHFLSEEELKMIYHGYPHILNSTDYIINNCHVTLSKNQDIIPRFSSEFDSKTYLESLAYKGLQKRFAVVEPRYVDRLKQELKVIEKLNYADYFLIVFDYVRYAKKNHILVGPGRGSAASSLVSYALGITDVDPIKYQLLFERFLNEERVSMPDIDIDFPDDKRDVVIKYVQDKYGELRVAHISTFATFGLKSTIKDVSELLGLSKVKEGELLKVLNELKEEEITAFLANEGLNKLTIDYSDIKEAVEIISHICELPRALSTHAAGIVMASNDLTNFTPLDICNDGIYQTEYDAYDLEAIGLLKMDFLSLRNLNIINRMVSLIQTVDEKFSLPNEFNDELTFKILRNALTYGVFQFESEGMKKMLQKINVSSFEDLAQAMALNRPGPLSMIDVYADRKVNNVPITYVDESLAKILKPTYGIILFQEQIILILREYAGYSLGEADIVRRAISKKQRSVMEQEEAKFISASIKKGHSEKDAKEIFSYIDKFADYGFPRAHSVSYSMIAYDMAYLKANYPKAFYAVMMDDLIGTASYGAVLKELKYFNIKIASPNINESTDHFIPNQNGLLMPLSQIKGIGRAYTEIILEERRKGFFKSFNDFIERLGQKIPSDLIENLIYASCFDEFKLTKKAMIDNLDKLLVRSKYSFVTNVSEIIYDREEYGYGYLLNKEKEVISINLKYDYFVQYQKLYDNKVVVEIKNINSEMKRLRVLVKIVKISTITTKNKELMAFLSVSDATGEMSVVVFPKQYDLIKDLKADMVLILEGSLRIKDNGEKELVLDSYRQV